MSYTPKLDWTPPNGVSAADMIRIEQGIKDTETLANTKFPKDGSEVITGPLNIVDTTNYLKRIASNLHLGTGSSASGMIIESGRATYITCNAYFNGTTWNRISTTAAAYMLEINKDSATGLTFYSVVAGANPIAWTANSVLDSRGGTITGTLTVGGPVIHALRLESVGSAANSISSLIYFNYVDSGGVKHTDRIMFADATGRLNYSRFGGVNDLIWDTSQLRINAGVMEYLDGGTWKAAGGVKSTQSGTVSIDTSVTPVNRDIPIVAVNTTKASARLTSTNDNQITISLLNATTVRITVHDYKQQVTETVSWEVVDYW